jgi:2-polyprenyl-3-methyl-5-hydroxy-6-metoxy-1,4-benzoquinol methylase
MSAGTPLHDPPLAACPLCGAPSPASLYRIDRSSPPFTVDRCAGCGFIFMNPRFTREVIASFYGPGYYEGNAEYTYYDERAMEKYARYVWERRIRALRRYAPSGNFLDVGCAFGGLLKCAARHYTPYGIEMSEYSGRYAKALFGDAVHIGTLEDHPFPPGSFSVVTMVEVIEHCADPPAVLRECRRLLAPGGVLLVQTANMDGLQASMQGDRYAYFMPGHLSYFSKRTLTKALMDAGFSRVIAFHPVEFGLLPKLLKSRSTFRRWTDYRHWLRISLYHLMGKVHAGDCALTSSMVLYAIA